MHFSNRSIFLPLFFLPSVFRFLDMNFEELLRLLFTHMKVLLFSSSKRELEPPKMSLTLTGIPWIIFLCRMCSLQYSVCLQLWCI